LQSWS
jgi:hypothetical protein